MAETSFHSFYIFILKKNCMQIIDHILTPNIGVGVNKPLAFELKSRPNPPTSRPKPVHFLFRKCWIYCSIHFRYWATLRGVELWSRL